MIPMRVEKTVQMMDLLRENSTGTPPRKGRFLPVWGPGIDNHFHLFRPGRGWDPGASAGTEVLPVQHRRPRQEQEEECEGPGDQGRKVTGKEARHVGGDPPFPQDEREHLFLFDTNW